jgi:hypothetical protein
MMVLLYSIRYKFIFHIIRARSEYPITDNPIILAPLAKEEATSTRDWRLLENKEYGKQQVTKVNKRTKEQATTVRTLRI